MLPPDDFLRYIVTDFDIKDPKATRGELLQQLNHFLIDANRRGHTAVLIIDEAHLLTPQLLEEVRLLTNIETPLYKLMQIVLVGQPELDGLLDSPNLRQLKQRIALRCRLQPLDPGDVGGYIARRLELAGAPPERARQIFSPAAVLQVQAYSMGIPRLINTMCDAALINGYAQRQKSISVSTIDEVAADLRLSLHPPALVLPEGGLAEAMKVDPGAKAKAQPAPEGVSAR